MLCGNPLESIRRPNGEGWSQAAPYLLMDLLQELKFLLQSLSPVLRVYVVEGLIIQVLEKREKKEKKCRGCLYNIYSFHSGHVECLWSE